MLGQIAEWFYHDLAGIQPDPAGPGFRKIVIKPAVVGDLSLVKVRYVSSAGPITAGRRREVGKGGAGELTLEVSIPANTTATVYVPSMDAGSVRESGQSAAQAAGVKFLRMESGCAVFSVGSGDYRFSSPSNLDQS